MLKKSKKKKKKKKKKKNATTLSHSLILRAVEKSTLKITK